MPGKVVFGTTNNKLQNYFNFFIYLITLKYHKHSYPENITKFCLVHFKSWLL